MPNNNDEKAARARRNLQKKAQDLAKNRDKYLAQNQKNTEKSDEKKSGPANASNNNRGRNNQNRGANNKNDTRKVNLPTSQTLTPRFTLSVPSLKTARKSYLQ